MAMELKAANLLTWEAAWKFEAGTVTDADMAMAIHRYPNTNMIEVVSRKNRHGHDFNFYLDWDINRGIVKEIYENPFQKDEPQTDKKISSKG